MFDFLYPVNDVLIMFSAGVMLVMAFNGMHKFSLTQRLGFTMMTGGMIWLTFAHINANLHPCPPCMMVLFGIHVTAIGVFVRWCIDVWDCRRRVRSFMQCASNKMRFFKNN